MNKQERKLKGLAKFKKRLKNYRLVGEPGKFYAYKSHGKPCSCAVCSPGKVLRNGDNKKDKKELEYHLSEFEIEGIFPLI